MKSLFLSLLLVITLNVLFAQAVKNKTIKYPSLLWEISGNGLKKPSYLFGTMHVSSKMAFNLSDSFYIALKNAQVVALETDPGSWQDDFSRYNLDGSSYSFNNSNSHRGTLFPNDYLSINTLKAIPYVKVLEQALYSSPSIINSFLYRSNSEMSSDFEEDTYLDLHIYQVGKKLGKKITGVEDFHHSMQLVKEAYADAAKEKNIIDKSFDYDDEFSYGKLEEAYRTGNLDLIDTINKTNSTSAAFDEKFLYKRNDIQAASIDSILKTNQTLFVGVGAAHLPGERGIIEYLRKQGYRLRPIKMNQRDGKHKDLIEKVRVPVTFTKQSSPDGLFSVNLPGKLYSFSKSFSPAHMQQYADMSNGSYYMITRIFTNALLWGHTQAQVSRKVDSILYENIPGKILKKKSIYNNGYNGYDITNRTRRGDIQRYNIFITPFEVLLFKISGNGEYVTGGKEADIFFNSIVINPLKTEWKKYKPTSGGFEVDFPHIPLVVNNGNWYYQATDNSGSSFSVIKTDIHNYGFVEEDNYDLNLLEESFASSEFIDKQISRKFSKVGLYPALDVKYRYKNGTIALVRFVLQGAGYYTIIANGKVETDRMKSFIQSFSIQPFQYAVSVKRIDTTLKFSVLSPVPIDPEKKLDMYPEEIYSFDEIKDDEDSLEEKGKFLDKIIKNDSTGERIYISFYNPSRYYYSSDSNNKSTVVSDEWVVRKKHQFELGDKTKVTDLELGSKNSSRMIRRKIFSRDGWHYYLETQLDTIGKRSSFISNFFDSFSPDNSTMGIHVQKKKTDLFFNEFFSSDTLLRKKSIKNIEHIKFDSSDILTLKESIQNLNWKDKNYLVVKKAFIGKLTDISSQEASDLLKEIYFASTDTLELQFSALESLLQQRTLYAYSVFADILKNDPPVLDQNPFTYVYNFNRSSIRKFKRLYGDFISASSTTLIKNGSFLDDLTDSLQLTKHIYPQLLPLLDLDDYEQPIMDLTASLVASKTISGKEYEAYVPKFLLEAKQTLKKQVINEKKRSIERARKDKEEKKYYQIGDGDIGNSKLSLYATLLMPYWNTNTAVPQFFNQLLSSDDKKLKYNTMILLLANNKKVTDTLINFFAANDDYRIHLFEDLKQYNKLNLFPVAQNNHIELSKSLLFNLNTYNKPEVIDFLEKLHVDQDDMKGYIYFFRYKEKKDDNFWKLASVGLLPLNEKDINFTSFENDKNVFNELTQTKLVTDQPVREQLEKALKKLMYSKRKSSVHFYGEEKYENTKFQLVR